MHINPSDIIGFESEAKVEAALEILRQDPKKHGLRSAIKQFIRAKRHSALDRKHVDFLVTLEEGTDVPLQVKSSERKGKKFERFCERHGLFIPAIVVHFGENMQSIIRQIVDKIKQFGNFVQRRANHVVSLNKMREQKRERRAQRKFPQFRTPCMCH